MSEIQSPLSNASAPLVNATATPTHLPQKSAEERMLESEVRYRTLFNSIDEGFCIIEFFDGPHGPLSNYVHIEANPAFERHTGIPNVVGKNVRDIVADEADGWVELYRNVLLTGQPIRFERTLVATDRYLELSAFRVEPESRRQVAVLFQDVTARKRAEEALRESQERLQAALDGSGTGTFRWNLLTNALDWDENLDRLFGLAPGKTIRSLEKFVAAVHPDDQPGVIERCQRCAAEGVDFSMEFRVIWPDGSLHWLDDQGKTFHDKNGRPIYMTGMCRDITQRKQVEQLMQSEAQRLEVLIQQRTAKLQTAVGELEAFSYSVAHDLRAPLRALSGYAKALAEEPDLSTTGRTYVQRIDRAATRMDRLTQEVLAYSQLSRAEIQLHSVNLDKLTHDLIEEYPNLAAHREHIVIRSPMLPVLGHESLLTQALANLLGNACKFVKPGAEPRVIVRTEEIEGDVRVWVEDSGIGIAPEHRNRLFKLFGRIHPDQKFPGTGIGLAIVAKAAERMGGFSGFDSQPGQGSRFWLQLKKP